MFLDLDDYPFLQRLASEWRTIAGELNTLRRDQFSPWPERDLYTGEWNVYALYAFGRKLPANCARCPLTTAMVEEVPGMVTAGFSGLAPGTEIKPHVGYTGKVRRFHLGLTRSNDCSLRVGDQTREWYAGSAFVFNDTVEHQAWNRGTDHRVILLLDFTPDSENRSDACSPTSLVGDLGGTN